MHSSRMESFHFFPKLFSPRNAIRPGRILPVTILFIFSTALPAVSSENRCDGTPRHFDWNVIASTLQTPKPGLDKRLSGNGSVSNPAYLVNYSWYNNSWASECTLFLTYDEQGQSTGGHMDIPAHGDTTVSYRYRCSIDYDPAGIQQTIREMHIENDTDTTILINSTCYYPGFSNIPHKSVVSPNDLGDRGDERHFIDSSTRIEMESNSISGSAPVDTSRIVRASYGKKDAQNVQVVHYSVSFNYRSDQVSDEEYVTHTSSDGSIDTIIITTIENGTRDTISDRFIETYDIYGHLVSSLRQQGRLSGAALWTDVSRELYFSTPSGVLDSIILQKSNGQSANDQKDVFYYNASAVSGNDAGNHVLSYRTISALFTDAGLQITFPAGTRIDEVTLLDLEGRVFRKFDETIPSDHRGSLTIPYSRGTGGAGLIRIRTGGRIIICKAVRTR